MPLHLLYYLFMKILLSNQEPHITTLYTPKAPYSARTIQNK